MEVPLSTCVAEALVLSAEVMPEPLQSSTRKVYRSTSLATP